MLFHNAAPRAGCSNAGDAGALARSVASRYVSATADDHGLPARGVAAMVLLAAATFAFIDCTRGANRNTMPDLLAG